MTSIERPLKHWPFNGRIAFCLLMAVAPMMMWTSYRAGVDHPSNWRAAIQDAGPIWLSSLIGMGIAWMYARQLIVKPLRAARAAFAEMRDHDVSERSSDPILRIGSNAKRNRISPAIEALLGYSPGDAETLSLRTVIHPHDLPRITGLYRHLSPEAPHATALCRLRHKNGSILYVEASFRRLAHHDETFETIVTLKDLTERHQEAETLRMVSEAARLAQADANEANQAKTEFLARMSHEIRTPLNSIMGFTALLLDIPMLPLKARRYGELIKGSGHALLSLVNDILDFSEVESGQVEVKPKVFALPLLIDECLSIVQQSALAKHLALDVALVDRFPAGVLCDEARLRQVLLNLLNNAIKFTTEGSIRLDVRYDREAGRPDRVRFSIIDTGIGIAAADLTRLFQRFRQVDGTNRRTYGGTGLGLAICKQLVELMGGEIGVTSEKSHGSTFWFTLDLPGAPLVLQPDENKPYVPKRALRLLLAEDVPLNQELVRVILEAAGHAVDIVGDGAEAIMAVQEHNYDAVLMDIQMPHTDGLTATRLIRNLPGACRDVPIIAMTANVLPEHGRLARAAGMNDVIHKPFSARDVYDLLDGLQLRSTGTPTDTTRVEAPTGALIDLTVAGKLIGFIGAAKVKALFGTLAHTIESRFDGDAATEEGRVTLRRDAHASVAGAGMLGFTDFSARCKALETAEDGAFQAILDALRIDAVAVTMLARNLSTGVVRVDDLAIAA